jgi:hypothetical protein
MKKAYILLILFFPALAINAQQKENYFVFAYGQKIINSVCGEKILIKQEEVSLSPGELGDYKIKIRNEIMNTYNAGTGYKNVYVDFAGPGQAMICYEAERTYDPKKDGWDCTTSFYGNVTAGNMEDAEKKLEIQKSENKTAKYKEIKRRDANQQTADKTQIALSIEGISIILKKVNNAGGNGTWLAQIKNPLKDEAAYVAFLVGSQRYPSDAKKSFKLQPGDVLSVTLGKGETADVLVRLGKTEEKEEPGVIYQLKEYIRQKVKVKDGKIETDGTPFSVRG